MERALVVQGGIPLRGELRVNPAKNSALKIMVASLLTPEPVTLTEIPRLRDVDVMLELLSHLGTRYAWEGHTLHLHTPEIKNTEAPRELVDKMRASFIVMGALLGRVGEAIVPMPGGCQFGPRPVDQHLKALTRLGAEIKEENGFFHAQQTRKPSGRVVFDMPTLGGTEQALLAAALGGEATLVNVAQEPEIEDLCHFLRMLGVEVEGIGSSILRVRGKERLSGGSYSIIPDRIEAGTFLLMTAATKGRITLTHVNPQHMDALLDKLAQSGHHIETGPDWVRLEATPNPLPFSVEAREYPGFATDLQPLIAAYLATVPGTSTVADRVYPDRFGYVGELARMGADASRKEGVLLINGKTLMGASVKAADIRAGGALILAALAAEGESKIEGMQYVERGYEKLPARLQALGAKVSFEQPALALAAD